MATPYSNYSLPQLYKLLTDTFGTGDIARAAEIAETIGNISGIEPDSAVRRAMRDAEGRRLPSLTQQALTTAQYAPNTDPLQEAPLRGFASRLQDLEAQTAGMPDAALAAPDDVPLEQMLSQIDLPVDSVAPPDLPDDQLDQLMAQFELPELSSVAPPAPVAETPTPALETALAEAAPTAPAKRASRRVLSGRAPMPATAPVTPTPVAATPTPQLVQELSTPTPTPVVAPKPVSELADGIPGASALRGTTTGAPSKRTPTFNPAGKAARQATQEASRQAAEEAARKAAEDAAAQASLDKLGWRKYAVQGPTPDGLKGLHANLTGGAVNSIGDDAVKGMSSIASKQGADLLKNATPTPKKGLAGLFEGQGNNKLNDISGPKLAYNKGTGVSVNGSNTLGKLGAGVAIATGALSGLNGLKESADEGRRTDDLSSDVILAAATDPMSTAGLTTSQLKTLGDVRSGRFSSDPDLGDIDWGGALSGGLTGALTGAAGGIPGAIAGGLAGVFGGGAGGFAQARARKNAELEALYQALNQSNAERAAARRRYY
jgi:hypothetical protein